MYMYILYIHLHVCWWFVHQSSFHFPRVIIIHMKNKNDHVEVNDVNAGWWFGSSHDFPRPPRGMVGPAKRGKVVAPGFV